MIKVTLVDYFSFFYRASLVSFTEFLTYNSETTGILFNLYRSYFYILKNFDNVILCIDGRYSRTLRENEFSEYKTNRKIQKEKFKHLYNWQKLFLNSVPYYSATNQYYEGDDIIASLTKSLLQKNINVNILTVDSDLWSLTDFNKVKIFDLKHRYKYVNQEVFSKRFHGLKNPKFVPIYKAIFGDKSDNIPCSIKPRKRKQKIINYLNNINYSTQILNDIYLKFHEMFKDDIDIDFLNSMYFLVELKDNISININQFIPEKEHYIEICKKYNFNKVPKFNDFITIFNKKSSSVKSIFNLKLNSEIDNLL